MRLEGRRDHVPDLPELFRSLRPDFIETEGSVVIDAEQAVLFRSPRPDFIETRFDQKTDQVPLLIVPVSKTGLH